MYLKSALSKKMKGDGQIMAQHDMNNGGNMPMAMNASTGQSHQPDASAIPLPAIQGIMALANTQDPQKIQLLLQYSSFPSDVLRARGVPQETVDTVELHRGLLQRTLMGQHQFHEGVKTSQMNNNLAALQQQRQNFLNNQPGQGALSQSIMQTPGAQGVQQQVPAPGMGDGGRGPQMPVNGMGNSANATQPARLPRPSPEEMQRAQQNIQRWHSEVRATYSHSKSLDTAW